MILLLLSSKAFFTELAPILIFMLIFGVTIGLWYLMKKEAYSKGDYGSQIDIKYEPFSVGPALKFVSIIVVINLVIQVLQFLHVNNTLLLIITALSGTTGIDAPTIALSGLTEAGVITLNVAIMGFLLTNAVN